MLTVHIIKDIACPEQACRIETDDLCALLASQWDHFPASARIYHEHLAKSCDVTPVDVAGIERLQGLGGSFYVVVYPEGFDPLTFFAIVAINIGLSFALQLLFPAKMASQERNIQKRSPNNALSNRINTERINGRIPDIFGTEWSTPDLIALPYIIFENNREVEICDLCIGRGSYTIHKVLEDTTPFADISASSLGIYGPDTSANSGDDPEYTIGDFTPTPIISAKRSNSVNGQVLKAPNDNRVQGDDDIQFVWPDSIYCGNSSINFTDIFNEDESLVVSGASYVAVDTGPPDGVVNLDFDGTYTILSVTSNTIVLVNPSAVNPNWNQLEYAGESAFDSMVLQVTATRWTDAVTLDSTTLEKVYANVVAVNGMYKDDGKNQISTSVEVELELTPVDGSGTATGPAETFSGTVTGSATDHQMKGVTIVADPTFTGRCKARMRRITDKDFGYAGAVVDEVQFRDLYAITPVSQEHFGNVTTVQTKVLATLSALAIKERKLKINVTRNIPARVSGSTFTTTLSPSDNASDILCAACLDPYIGGRSIDELDVDSIYDTIDGIGSYFGTDLSTEWGGTFSDANTSFEETVGTICNAVFCRAYRRGSTIRLSPETATDNSVLLFCHRNKVPRSETRTYSFGTLEKYDGVEVEWADPDDGAVVTTYLPDDQSAINAQKIEALGVRNNVQAHFLAWRAYNKLRYRYVDAEFDAMPEADILVAGDRVLVADNTRQGTQDGEVVAVDGLTVTTSQECAFEEGKTYTVFLQLPDGTVEAIPCEPGSSSRSIVLDSAPSIPLALDEANYANAAYTIVADDDPRAIAFLVTEITPQDNATYKVSASNYDARYYEHDTDFINSIVVEE